MHNSAHGERDGDMLVFGYVHPRYEMKTDERRK